jgi:streptogramin lyase
MFPNDLFVIDAYKAKVLKISNDVSSEIFDLEKEVGIVNPKDTTPKEENPVETITGHGKKDPFAGKPGYSSITVSQDKVSLFITNRNNGYLYHYKKNVGEGKYTLFQKVKVGKQPVACCEDPNGNIYVANYGDNTVSKVEVPSYKNTSATENEDLQDKVVKNIAVAAGPKSLVSDEEGTIWVACYLSHKIDPKTGADLGGIVNKIVNTTVVDSINVGSNPAAITCDTSNTIWVANSGSNTVSRILKSKKVVDFEVGARPVALVNDSYGNVIVANYDGNTVTIIETSSKAIKEGNNITTIPVGKGPNAIDVNMDDDVYVVCGLENTIHKISGKQVVSVVEVCDSPVAFGDFSGCANYNAQNVMAKADKGTTEEKIQTALDKAKQSEDSVKEMSARVEHALEDVKAAKQAVEAKTEQIAEAVTKAGNAEQKATANAESIEAIKTGKLETTVFESYKSATAEKIDAATQKATTNEENIGQIKTNKLDVSVFESYKTEADGKFATKAELAAAGTSGSGAGTGTASLTPADQAKINKIDGIETDVTSIKAVTDGLKDKTFVEDSAFNAYKSEAEGKFATKDEITTSGTGNLSVADKAKINKIDDIETTANAAKAVTDTLKDKTFVEDSAFNAYKSEVETKYATKAEVTTAGTGLSSADQAKIAKIDGIETKADDAKAVTDTLKGKTFVEESAFNTYKSDADGKFATKAEVQNIHGLSEDDQTKIAKIDAVETAANAAKAVTDTLKDKTFVEESALDTKFTEKLQPVTQDVTSKYNELKQSIESVSTAGLPENVKQDIQSAKDAAAKLNEFESKVTEAKNAADSINAVKADVAAAKAVTDSIKDKTFVEESAFNTYKSDADGKFATKAELTSAGTGLSSADQTKIAKIDTIESTANAAKAVTDTLSGKTFVEDATFTLYKSEADNKFATKAEVPSLTDKQNIAKISEIETAANAAKAVTDTLSGKTFVEKSVYDSFETEAREKFQKVTDLETGMSALNKRNLLERSDLDSFKNDINTYYAQKSTVNDLSNRLNDYATQTYVESRINSAKGDLATKAEVQAIHGLTEEDQTKLAKLDKIDKEVDILNKLDALHIKILKLEPDSGANTNTVYFEFDKVTNPISLPEDFDLNNGNILNSNDASSHPLKFVSLDGSKTETCSASTFNDSTCFKLVYSTTSSGNFPLGDSSFVAKVILPYNPSSSTEGVNSSVFKELEVYIRTIDDNTLTEKAKPDKIQMYVASGLFPVANRTTNDGTYEQYNGDYIPSSTKVNAESLLEFNDFSSSSDIGINRKIFEDATKIVDGNAAITIPLNIVETNILRGRTVHNDFNTVFLILPKELTEGKETISVFMDYQRQIVHKYPEEKIAKEAYKKYNVYYFISNTNITEGLYLNIVL